MSKPDPITLEIIQNSLQAAADKMFVARKKTAMSSIIYEVLDMGTGRIDLGNVCRRYSSRHWTAIYDYRAATGRVGCQLQRRW